MDNLNKEEEETREFQYVYFIESHQKGVKPLLLLYNKNNEADNLECVKIKDIEENKRYEYYLFRFRIYPSKIN